jgi:hypothetical protein
MKRNGSFNLKKEVGNDKPKVNCETANSVEKSVFIAAICG